MTELKERDFFTNFIGQYRKFPCLWDLSSGSYKDVQQKKNAWRMLTQKYKVWDSNANEATVKKKIENLKSSYQREAKKVRDSKMRDGVLHEPSLWYYKLMTFLEKNETSRDGMDSFKRDHDDDDVLEKVALKRKKLMKERNQLSKQEKLIDAAEQLLKTEIDTKANPFGIYVGKKIEEIPLGQQRDIAEKLITDIIFLAKTKSLTFDTKIDIPSSRGNSSHNLYYLQTPPSTHSSSDNPPISYQYFHVPSPPPASRPHPAPSPTLNSPIPKQSPPGSPDAQHDPLSSLTHSPTHSPEEEEEEEEEKVPCHINPKIEIFEGPTSEILKQLLIKKS